MTLDLDLEATEVFERNYDADTRIVINRGGTRSSKTYSLNQLWAVRSFEEYRKRILVSRLTFPSLRLSALQDFLNILVDYELEDHFKYNRTYHYFENKYTGTQIHFVSSDNPQKVRSQAWDYIHLVEANEIPWETFRQYLMRLRGQFYIDFNPSEPETWINVELEQKRPQDCTVIKSSYLDNPYLPIETIKEIEYLRDTDENYWHIYGLGEYGVIKNKIWSGWQSISKEEYDKIPATDEFAGYDDGFISPRAGVKCKWYNETLYIDEIYYKSYQDVDDMIKVLKKQLSSINTPIYCDTENAAARFALGQAGLNALKANKKVKWGLDYVRRFKNVKVTDTSVNIWKEYNKYKYKEDINGVAIPEPVKFDDHLMDAIRYAVVSHLFWVFEDM